MTINAEQAAKILECRISTIIKLRASGELPEFKKKAGWYWWQESDVIAYKPKMKEYRYAKHPTTSQKA